MSINPYKPGTADMCIRCHRWYAIENLLYDFDTEAVAKPTCLTCIRKDIHGRP